MKTRHWFPAFAALALGQADVPALTPPSDSDGPIRLLNCIVSPTGVLEAEVDSTADDAMSCNISCQYEFGGKPFSQWFEVTIPKRFHGRVGHFDTNGGRPGNFPGSVGTCKKTDIRGLR